MIIKNRIGKRGFSVNLLKGARLKYPSGIWECLGKHKKILADNLTYLKISPYSMFLDKEMYFDFSSPFLKELGDKGVKADIPRVAEEDDISTKDLMQRFSKRRIRFKDDNENFLEADLEENAVIGISFGKDSLLSYGVAKELGLATNLVFVQDCWDTETVQKLLLIRRFEREFGSRIEIMEDEIDDISCHKGVNKTRSEGIVGSNAMNGYLVMLLPFALKFKANNIIFGNEQNFNDFFVNEEGYKVYPSYEQSGEWMMEQNKSLKDFTGGIQVRSLIEPLYNLAEVKVLFNRYPKIAKYQMSCGLAKAKSKKERWCYDCPMCAKAFLYIKAFDFEPSCMEFHKDMFKSGSTKLYPLFNRKPERVLEKPQAVRDEQLFSFYLAYKNRSKGYLIKRFQREFLAEAKKREDELWKKFLSIHDAVSLKGSMKNEVRSIYKEELR